MTDRAEEFRSVVSTILEPYSVAAGAVDRICEAYGEHWRTYHNADHILGMLHGAQLYCSSFDTLPELCLLIVYHDVWIKIGRDKGESERRSANWAIDDLLYSAQNPHHLHKLMRQGIEATINHTLENVDEAFAETVGLLLDLDLWGLGQSPEYFQKNTEQIWHEFEPRYMRDEYDEGRRNWASTFLKRPFIYHNSRFFHLEEAARTNLKALAGIK